VSATVAADIARPVHMGKYKCRLSEIVSSYWDNARYPC